MNRRLSLLRGSNRPLGQDRLRVALHLLNLDLLNLEIKLLDNIVWGDRKILCLNANA